MSISLRALAQAAGVSIGTASRALKHQAGVSEQQRQHVQQLAAKLGYDISRLQRAPIRRILFLLHAQHTTANATPFYAEVERGARLACLEKGIELQPFSVNANSSIRRQLLQQEADAILCVGFIEPETLAVVQALGKPTTLIDASAPQLASVNPDNQAGTRLMTAQLIAQGRQRIAFLSGSLAHHSIRLRERGYREALFQAGRLADPALEALIPPGLDLVQGTRLALNELMNLATPPDAIIAFNDACALIVQAECKAHGMTLPDDMLIAGFDDIAAAEAAQLSTVAVDKAALGAAGVAQLLAAAERPDVSEILHPVKLILRGSTSAAVQTN
ncbi:MULTISPECIES: LacI family DNA-binding transcriptional regulator [Deefgea]|uniref:Substrate-binding domain-containing protein n=1 Tax=Deefgea chitinilytica TaxID=570276 RepID=A0ABS2CC47_9NEIS|nr:MULTISPECIES: LacI family DNA-binding transcriptional regulator [Deefgea]MBM5571612.1 substrate-binding domain-containing protein [Deefgea chitinilytica]MBM9888847.1 LacI family DNA-binding transcriptional regulator [Deefgea sp. CFH1-16]